MDENGFARDLPDSASVIVTAGRTPNSLGVVRAFGRRGIPVVLLGKVKGSLCKYSRYVTEELECSDVDESENETLDVLNQFGARSKRPKVIIPTGDHDALVLAKIKKRLKAEYQIPVPDYSLLRTLGEKDRFYRLLEKYQVPHPKTRFPSDSADLIEIGQSVEFPYIIKPALSLPFQNQFCRKCFCVTSHEELVRAATALDGSPHRVVLQEILPGSQLYEYYVYFDRTSTPLAVCGWDKMRHFPPRFGSGSFCRSRTRGSVIETGIRLLQTLGYQGFAAVEVMKDQRSGEHKIIEVNVRTTLQNRLAAACGVDMEILAYLDLTGNEVASPVPVEGIHWVDDFVDAISLGAEWRSGKVSLKNVISQLTAPKVHSVLAWDDPLPVGARIRDLGKNSFKWLAARG